MQTTERFSLPNHRRRAARLLALWLAAPLPGAIALAQDGSTGDTVVPLEEYVVSVTRTPQDPQSAPGSVTRIDLDNLADLQIGDLPVALAREPGVTIVNTGATGAQSSVFLRGASSHQTLFVVDGVRMSDRSASYVNFLGGADVSGLERIEVLRGPQGTLYGSSAMGGIILLETARAAADSGAHGAVAAHAGSFDTRCGVVSVRHGAGNVGVTAALARHVTSNDQDGNGFETWNTAARIEGRPGERLVVGATWRGQWSDYEETGSRFFPSPGMVESENHLVTTYGEWHASNSLQSRLTLATHRREYSFASTWGVSRQSNRRHIADLQNTWKPVDNTEIVFGANHERAKFVVDGVPTRDEMLAGYVSAVVRPREEVTLIAGGRYDDFDSVGGAETWRIGGSWLVRTGTKLRATLGTGFSAPGSEDSEGVPHWGQLPNRGLLPEESRGWDIGIDHAMLDGNLTVSATWFQNRFRNLFEWETVNFTTFEGRIVNRARATTEGGELALSATLHPAVQARVAYTYLDARNDSDDVRLIRRPRHTVDADVTFIAARHVSLGAGLHAVADRVESFSPAEDYTTVRLFASWAVREDLRVRLRIENALDETYEEVLGYPALPRGVFGGVEWRF